MTDLSGPTPVVLKLGSPSDHDSIGPKLTLEGGSFKLERTLTRVDAERLTALQTAYHRSLVCPDQAEFTSIGDGLAKWLGAKWLEKILS